MKRSTLSKLALTLVAAFVFVGANAQPWSNATEGDYTRSAANPITNPASVTFTDKVTINKTMPFWVFPSVAYNPDYVTTGFTTNYTTSAQIVLNVVSSFAWTAGVDGTTSAANKNYVEITWSSVGDKTISVIETPAAGICPGDAVYFGVKVINEPSASIDGANVELGLNNVISRACWSATAPHNVAINTTLANADEEYPYHFNVTYEVFNVDGLDAAGELPNAAGVFDAANADVTDITGATTVNVRGSVTPAANPSDANPIILAAGNELVASQDYVVQNNKITVYRITYNNVNAKISRKSDYLAARAGTWAATDYANFSYYPAAPAATAKYIVSLPIPVTGPIYHIANNFAY
ncbi:hypothetical protein DSECCO2_193020 [anaerobic digester metagenome]